MFGVACIACIYVVAPVLDNRFSMLSLKVGIIVCAALLTVFIADNIYSSKYPNLEGMSPKSREQYLKDNPDAYKHQLWNVLGIKNMQKKYKIKG